ncbi:MAG TPA: hypothetical protein VLH13_02640 [Methanomassiliicoccales archaeon]|nr:hypothetical protein [Methanomassiliicoccales archaeon]
MKSDCRIEMAYIDPVTYTSIVNHEMRKDILRALYSVTRNQGPVTKQKLADHLNIGYHQLVYQLNNHLKDFWQVKEEQKVRGTRMELIAPAYPDTIFITLGKENSIYLVDPIANIFGSLSKVGLRCDGCTTNEARKCLDNATRKGSCCQTPRETEMAMLMSNGRRLPFRVVDHAILCALRGIPEGSTCSIELPCDSCPFMKKIILIK